MMPFMHRYVYLFIGCLLLTSCSQVVSKNQMDVELEAVEQVSVLSADGQEIQLPLPLFLGEIEKQGKQLRPTDKKLMQSDLRYTLLVRRRSESPLVVQIGRNMSQLGTVTYEGTGAGHFYHWIRELTAGSIFTPKLRNGEIRANGLNRQMVLEEKQREELASLLQRAVYKPVEEISVPPLFPDYQLKLDYGQRTTEVSMLTPTVAAVRFGNDTLYYDIPEQLYARLSEWLLQK